ncbi:hypothetical protein B0H11DRAFT_2246201 [Mycena galericulata]|nr:hypothetical protein B0H11DRAFT_2246201 [Mycena galericulata]
MDGERSELGAEVDQSLTPNVKSALKKNRARTHTMFKLSLPVYLGAIWVAYRVIRFLKVLNTYGYVKGYRPLLDPHSLPGNAIPANWWHMGFMWPWIQRKHAHFNHTHDLTTLVPLLMGNGAYFAASVGVAKQVWGNEAKTHLLKPADFTTERFARVVEKSALVYNSMKEELGSAEHVLTNLHSLLLRFTLVMVCRCGFGMPVAWKQSKDQDEIAIFDRALFLFEACAKSTILKTVMALSDALAASRRAQYSTEKDMGEEHAHDLFTKLVSAADGNTKYALEPPEVTGNMLSLLFAGNETTSSALMSTLVFLGL